jgi:two-component system response regulator HydG
MSTHTRVLLVDADVTRAGALVELLSSAGYETSHAAAVPDAHAASADVALLSVDVVATNDVPRLAAAASDAELLLLVGSPGVAVARGALRMGARDVIEREAGADVLFLAIERAARERAARRELAMLRARVGDDARHALVGRSSTMSIVRELVGGAAASRRTVLVTGEAGTGKSTVARLVHDLSERAARPFVIVRCEGTAPDALEAELFGAGRGGLLEAARGGTLVLDEAHAMSGALRARLAAMLAERVVRRAGSSDGAPVDVRLVLTARSPGGDSPLEPGGFLGDAGVLPIALPPLRERRSDIPLLVQHFRERMAQERGSPLPPLGAGTMAPLLGHHWPGNVRELEHWVDRIALTAMDEGSALHRHVVAPGIDVADVSAARLTLEALERRYILHVLAQEGGHQSRAADRLGIDRRTLYRKLKEYRDDGVAVRVTG